MEEEGVARVGGGKDETEQHPRDKMKRAPE
jgi:hypothetical protein